MRLDFVIEVKADGTGTQRYSRGGDNKGNVIEGLLTALYKSARNGQGGAIGVYVKEIGAADAVYDLYEFTGVNALAGNAKRPLQAASYGRSGTTTGMSVHETVHGVLEVSVTGAVEGKCYISLGMLENTPV